jgi:hypothetical protein
VHAFEALTKSWRSGRIGAVLGCASAIGKLDDGVIVFRDPELRAELCEYLERTNRRACARCSSAALADAAHNHSRTLRPSRLPADSALMDQILAQ